MFEAVQFLKTGSGKLIHILYAGSGPFATLVLPLFTIFSKSALQVTLLEINPISFNRVKQTISKPGFNNHIKAFENVDATKYVLMSLRVLTWC